MFSCLWTWTIGHQGAKHQFCFIQRLLQEIVRLSSEGNCLAKCKMAYKRMYEYIPPIFCNMKHEVKMLWLHVLKNLKKLLSCRNLPWSDGPEFLPSDMRKFGVFHSEFWGRISGGKMNILATPANNSLRSCFFS